MRQAASAAEILEERVLPAVTLLIDYSLDNGFFNTAEKRAAIESVAQEIGARLTDALGAVPRGTYSVTDPRTFATTSWTFDVPANAIRVFVAGSGMASGTVGQGGWRTNTGLRNFNAANDFAPYVGYLGFDNDGSTSWNFSENPLTGVNFRAVARHELLHALGLGGAQSWNGLISGAFFTGAKTRAANGGVNPPVVGGHFAQGVDSIMAPVISTITHPTDIDWAALDDIGWDVTTVAPPVNPGVYADVFGRASNGTWWVSRSSGTSLTSGTQIGSWGDPNNWRDVATGDFDGNGLIDVVGRLATTGDWWVGLSNGSSFVNRKFGNWYEAAGWKDVNVGDFNGDGKDDVAGRTSYGDWWIGLSNGGGFVNHYSGSWSAAAGWKDVNVGDFNGDGKDDVIGRTSGGAWWAGVSNGSALANHFVGSWYEPAGWRDVLAADFNADGKLDLAGRTASGVWYVSRSTGTTLATGLWAMWNESAGWRGVMAADFNNDGRADLVGRTALGGWYASFSTGLSFNTTGYGSWWEGAGWRDIQIGDFAHHTARDVLARAADGTWWVGENTGSTFNFRSMGRWNEGMGWPNVFSSRSLFVTAAGGAVAGASAGAELVDASVEEAAVPLAATVLGIPSSVATGDAAWAVVPAADEEVLPPPRTDRRDMPRVATVGDEWDRAASADEDLFDQLDSAFGDAGLLDALTAV